MQIPRMRCGVRSASAQALRSLASPRHGDSTARAVLLRPAMLTSTPVHFDEPDLLAKLAVMPDRELDALDFGVIGFGSDEDARVLRYSACEARHSGLAPASVVGLPLFSVVAQCLNNYLVAQRFVDAKLNHTTLDASLDYILTLRMRPTPVTLRLLASPAYDLRYVVIAWSKRAPDRRSGC